MDKMPVDVQQCSTNYYTNSYFSYILFLLAILYWQPITMPERYEHHEYR